MKKYYTPINSITAGSKGKTYYCDSPLYNECTLFLLPSGKGIAVIQQHFTAKLKYTWWGRIDERIAVDISQRKELEEYLNEKAEFPVKGIYPHVEVRKMMWAMKLPSLTKQFWETRF